MLKQDMQRLKKQLPKYRRSRAFESQFSDILVLNPVSSPLSSLSPTQQYTNICQAFTVKFPLLSYLKQSKLQDYSYVSMIHNASKRASLSNHNHTLTLTQNNINNHSKTQLQSSCKEQPDQQEIINRDDQQLWRKHRDNVGNLPILQNQQEIIRVIACFKQMEQQNNQKMTNEINKTRKLQRLYKGYQNNCNISENNIYDRLHEIYLQKGGQKDYEQFKDKIQSDVLYLVTKENKKKH